MKRYYKQTNRDFCEKGKGHQEANLEYSGFFVLSDVVLLIISLKGERVADKNSTVTVGITICYF